MQRVRGRTRRTRAGGARGRAASLLLVAALLLIWAGPAAAFRLIGSPGNWARWDAALRFVDGEERSLVGGLRYSIEHGDYGVLKDEFLWLGTPPTDAEFEEAVGRAFEHWEIVDPATALPAGFYFVEDLATTAVDQPPTNPFDPAAYLGANAGAEIDIFAETPHAGPSFGASVVFFLDPVSDDLTLTSGTPNYDGVAIAGADIRMNTAFVWTLSSWETLLTHEIGHALGLADLEVSPGQANVSGFIDDDYDPSTSATAAATLTNPFALQIDPVDPDASALFSFPGNLNTDPGLDSPGALLLMESQGWQDLRNTDPKLQNDDFAGRQFLYPVPVPEPGVGLMLVVGAATLPLLARRRATCAETQR
ncbi:MAG: hypothetical protein AAGC67_19815 [Myxococcota bacterium]